ncbi:hypothetical protein ACFLRH_00310 [Actinomycetota bacterium]
MSDSGAILQQLLDSTELRHRPRRCLLIGGGRYFTAGYVIAEAAR